MLSRWFYLKEERSKYDVRQLINDMVTYEKHRTSCTFGSLTAVWGGNYYLRPQYEGQGVSRWKMDAGRQLKSYGSEGNVGRNCPSILLNQ